MDSPGQTAELVEGLQARNTAATPLLIAIDQEGGQLQGLVGSTPFAGNMALGAADDVALTRRVAQAMGHELAGMLLGEESASVFTKVPHPTRFYYRGNPWFLTPASILYRTLDRLNR